MGKKAKGTRRKKGNPAKLTAEEKDSRASYAVTHWSDHGNGKILEGEALDTCKEETLVTLGVLREISYETVKAGDGGPAIYDHSFSKRYPPILAYGKKSGKLVIISPKHGGYWVSWRGIVG